MSLLAELRGKRVLILGFGREGRSTVRFLREHAPDASLGVADRRTADQMTADEQAILATLPADGVTLGPEYLDAVARFDAVVRAPGLPPDAPPLQVARSRGARVTSLVNLFFDVAPERIVNTEYYDPGDIGGSMGDGCLVTVTLEESNGVTVLTTHMDFGTKESRDAALATGMTDGMEQSYQLLDELLRLPVGSPPRAS